MIGVNTIQEGSFLTWLFWGAVIGVFVLRSAKEQEPPVMAVYVLSFLGIVAILVKQSPFRFLDGAAAGQVPFDGQGLNPLLQNPWMTIHPPIMFFAEEGRKAVLRRMERRRAARAAMEANAA